MNIEIVDYVVIFLLILGLFVGWKTKPKLKVLDIGIWVLVLSLQVILTIVDFSWFELVFTGICGWILYSTISKHKLHEKMAKIKEEIAKHESSEK